MKGIKGGSQSMDVGFNLIEEKSIESGKVELFENKMSIIQFLRKVSRMEDIPLDVSIIGFDQLLFSAVDRKEMTKYIRDLLIEKVNFLLNKSPCVQIIVDGSLEQWQKPIIRLNNEDLDVYTIFGKMERRDVNWFYTGLNIQS